jgi:type III secretion protein V
MTMEKLNGFLLRIRERQDLVLIAILLTAVIVMIIPMPVLMIDILIAFNISLTMLVLIVSVYLDRPTSFSTFPAILLIATTFRLAISISTTRTVLTTAEGGAIIETFGNFVTGGNIVVGLVIFLIITIVQFIVITKGAERVAEVAARFVLDALPGRQLSIDAELRAGDITPDEARARRRQLDKENQFFGAMDGAMKFVKGDAIAGLLIIAVNIIGGITIGAMQLGMSIGEAAQTFSLLTIGDGLVAQIPALLIALCAGAVVTRVSTENSADLGKDIVGELTASSRTLMVTGGVVSLIGLVPGFPVAIFLIFGGILAFTGYRMAARQTQEVEAKRQAEIEEREQIARGMTEVIETGETSEHRPGEIFMIRLGRGLAARIDHEEFTQLRDQERAAVTRRLGVPVGRFGLLVDETLAENSFTMMLDQVTIITGVIPSDAIAVDCDVEPLDILRLPRKAIPQSWRLNRVTFVREADRDQLIEAKIPLLPPAALLVRLAFQRIVSHLGQIIGYDDIRRILDQAKKESPQLFEQVQQSITVATLHDVMRRLIDENVPLTPLRLIMEGLMEWSAREADPAILAEHVRRTLRRQICNRVADRQRQIAAYIIEPELEMALRDGVRSTEAGTFLSLPSSRANQFLTQIDQIRTTADPAAAPPVIVTSVDLRRHVQAYLRTHGLNLAVLSFQEIASEFSLLPVGTLGEAKSRREFSNAA